jgi:acid stress-induced BolA-like protein IbaG/YrbA
MVTPEQVKSYIEEGLACQSVQVTGDGHHFEAVIVSAAFAGKNKVQQHQLVYALSMQTYTPEDYARK